MSGDPLKLTFAETQSDFRAFGAICRRYAEWCRNRYSDMPWFVDEVASQQSLDAELEDLPAKYRPPAGRAVIATENDRIVAGGAYRRLSETTCELKRVFVADEARGAGLGRRLSEALIDAAKTDLYRMMLLDTGDRLVEAQRMYDSLGFIKVDPYQRYPDRLMPYLIFMRKEL